MSVLSLSKTQPPPTKIGSRTFEWGSRTFVMGVVNVTPDSFSGDGLLAGEVGRHGAAAEAAVLQCRHMLDAGADIIDIGGESTRPGHAPVDEAEERERVLPAIRAVREQFPEAVISIDTSKVGVAAAALEAGADMLNDVWGVGGTDDMARLAARAGVPLALMHNRDQAHYIDVVSEVVADLTAAVGRARDVGVPADSLIVDPGFGFGKLPVHNLLVLRGLDRVVAMGQPVLLGTSRKSTIGLILGGVPPEERLDGTLATTALGIAAGAHIIRVHDVRANLQVAQVCDAVLRGAMP
jgi:dihydropteroate synthase